MSTHIEKLSGADASWLHLESEDVPLHVASCPIFQLPEGTDTETFFKQVKELVRQRAPALKNYRIRRVDTPFGLDHPVWHDDVRNIDFDYHIRRVRLPKPGSLEQLEAACSRIAAAPMDMNRPLWEYHLIEGIQGNRVCLVIKIHHAVIDGESGVMQLDLMMDRTPEPRHVVLPDNLPEGTEAPHMWELLSDAFLSFMRQPLTMLESLPRMAEAANNYSSVMMDRLSHGETLNRVAPPTPFNRSVSRSRRYVMASVPLGEAKAIKNALKVTLNDVVMSVCAGALRRYLLRAGSQVGEELLAMVPVSLRRGDANADHMGTLVTGMVCGLATDIADPIDRLRAVNKRSRDAKAQVEATKGAMIQNYNIAGAPLALRLASQLYGGLKLADLHQPMFNVTISNVAGPREVLYLNGARMLHYHPLSLITHGLGLNITVQSYCDTLDFGLISCAKLLPDLAELRDDLLASFEELRNEVFPDAAAGVAPDTVRGLSMPRAGRTAPVKAKALRLPSRRTPAGKAS
ncbi:wax ester/triacylglycerol synthase family O-acyltransferase [Iodidimonas sp. SYSU 1G8]|uniref:WS/DGAT/MGAT family O-acyltransferase n=1 Tax=Iodidimonas sp. SYSU 1G8 TaxID=3133967 RepID=UPI0031FE7339